MFETVSIESNSPFGTPLYLNHHQTCLQNVAWTWSIYIASAINAGLHRCPISQLALLSRPILHAVVMVNSLITNTQPWRHFYCPWVKGQVLTVTNKSLPTMICPQLYCSLLCVGESVLGPFGATKRCRCSNALYEMLWCLHISYTHPPTGFKLNIILGISVMKIVITPFYSGSAHRKEVHTCQYIHCPPKFSMDRW